MSHQVIKMIPPTQKADNRQDRNGIPTFSYFSGHETWRKLKVIFRQLNPVTIVPSFLIDSGNKNITLCREEVQ